jgi:hypothetical protein
MVATLKYDDHGLRKVRHPLAFSIRETTFEWSETQRLMRDFDERFSAVRGRRGVVKHPLGRYLYAYRTDRSHALAVCEYVDFPDSKERGIFTSCCEPTREGKLAFYALFNHLIETMPPGWQAEGVVAWTNEPMRKMIEQSGLKPKGVIYAKERSLCAAHYQL